MASATLKCAAKTTSQGEEGFDGGRNKEFIRFLKYSQRSCPEVQSQLSLAMDQEYITRERFQQLYDLAAQVHSKVGAFIAYLLRSERIR